MVLLVYLLAEAELASTNVFNGNFWTNTIGLATSDIDLGVVEFLQTDTWHWPFSSPVRCIYPPYRCLELAVLQSSALYLSLLTCFAINAW